MGDKSNLQFNPPADFSEPPYLGVLTGSGLVSYWTYDNVIGSVVMDSSGIGNNLTLLTPYPALTSGYYGNALSFNRVDNKASCNNINLTSGLTLSAWIRVNVTNSWGQDSIITKMDLSSPLSSLEN